MKVITPAEFKEQMREIFDDPKKDIESQHGSMDGLMCDVLKSLGYGAGIEIYDKQKKWYA